MLNGFERLTAARQVFFTALFFRSCGRPEPRVSKSVKVFEVIES